MPIFTENRAQVVILRPHGNIDKLMAMELEELLATAIDDGTLNLVIDFSGVSHIGSDGLKVILGGLKRLQTCGGRLVQSGASDDVRAVLDVSGFMALLGEFETVDVAVARLQTTGAGPAVAS